MKYMLLLLLGFSLAPLARAGGFGAEMPAATVVAIEKGTSGWVAVVTGEFDLVTAAGIVRLPAECARLRVPMGNQLYALRGDIHRSYEKRLYSTIGRKVLIQMWGPIVTIEGGRVVEVVAGDISLLRPTKQEAAFDLSRLFEIGQR
jgi:hypothetical protein